MIKIKLTDEEISVIGHANDKEHPRCVNSIRACEAMTALTQNLVLSVRKLGHDVPDFDLDFGKFVFKTAGLSDISRILVDSFIVGANMAQTAYTDYISVIDDRSRLV